MKKILSNKNIWLPIFFFGFIYVLISFGNHYNFRTYARDLGIFTNALYDYSTFHWNEPTVLHLYLKNILGDHFILIALLISPFTWIFGSYTLLVFQILSILFGGFGVYRIINNKFGKTIATLALIHFFFNLGNLFCFSF